MAISKFSTEARNVQIDATIDLIMRGRSPGRMILYSGPMAKSPELAPPAEARRLAVLVFETKTHTPASGARGVFPPAKSDAPAEESGRCEWCRFADSGNRGVADVDVGDMDSTAFLKMNTTEIVKGGWLSSQGLELIVGAPA